MFLHIVANLPVAQIFEAFDFRFVFVSLFWKIRQGKKGAHWLDL